MEAEFWSGKHVALPLMYSYDDIHCDLMGLMGLRAPPLYFHPRFLAKPRTSEANGRNSSKWTVH